jgi:hypothetical protein
VWRRIDDPSELDSLSAVELVKRVRPLLERGGLRSKKERLERVRENIPSACAELALEWKRSPRLRGRQVGFGEYLAARLCAKLHELDQAQHPHLYDDHRNYRPERETLPLYEERAGEEQLVAGGAAVPDLAQAQLEQDAAASERIREALRNANIAVASQPGVLRAYYDFNSGQISTPYRLARALGNSTLEARNHPATGPYLALQALQPATGGCY